MYGIPGLNPTTNAPNNAVHGRVTIARPSTVGQTSAYSVPFSVPDGVYRLNVVFAVGGGGAGGSTNGSPGQHAINFPLEVVPGEILLVTLGIGGITGLGGSGGATSIGNRLTLTGGNEDSAAIDTARRTPLSVGSPLSFNNTGSGGVTALNGYAGSVMLEW